MSGRTKIDKFFEGYGFEYVKDDEDGTYKGHINHSRSDYYEEHYTVVYEKTGEKYSFIVPTSGTKMYYFQNKNGGALRSDSIVVAGFSQAMFIENVKRYFNL